MDEALHCITTGWWWFRECFLEWTYCMSDPDNLGGDFFCHICSDYCAYEEATND